MCNDWVKNKERAERAGQVLFTDLVAGYTGCSLWKNASLCTLRSVHFSLSMLHFNKNFFFKLKEMIHNTSNLFNFNLKHINAHSFTTLLMWSQGFSLRRGLLTAASCHLSYTNHTHNASSAISSISFFEVERDLKDPCKAIECTILLEFYDFPNLFIVSTTPNIIASYFNTSTSFQSFQLSIHRNISLFSSHLF